MSSADPIFGDRMIHMIVFLVVSSLIAAGFVASMYWIASAAYQMPDGVKDGVVYANVVKCFAPRDALTLRQIHVVDMNLFTSDQATRCLAPGAYQLKIGDKAVQTSSWTSKSSTKSVPLSVRILKNGELKDTTLFVEVQHE